MHRCRETWSINFSRCDTIHEFLSIPFFDFRFISVVIERRLAIDHFIDQNPKSTKMSFRLKDTLPNAPPINGCCMLLSLNDLGCHVLKRTHKAAGTRFSILHVTFAKSKVRHFDMPFGI